MNSFKYIDIYMYICVSKNKLILNTLMEIITLPTKQGTLGINPSLIYCINSE